jgi:hypothetical protein
MLLYQKADTRKRNLQEVEEMKTIQCDVCKRVEPNCDVRYQRRRRFAWFLNCREREGINDKKLDVCTDCWDGFKVYMRGQLTSTQQVMTKEDMEKQAQSWHNIKADRIRQGKA